MFRFELPRFFLILQDQAIEARSTLIRKVHRGLITLRLPISFASLLCLPAMWNDQNIDGCSFATNSESLLSVSDVKQMLVANVTKRRRILCVRAHLYNCKPNLM
jgi:hypothetical protein